MFDKIKSQLENYNLYENDIIDDDNDQNFQTSTIETIQGYTDQIYNSIKSTLSYVINTNHQTGESLSDLQSQNEQINRIKVDLNKSHENVSITERLVEKYVNSISWLSNSISWVNPMTLETQDCTNDQISAVVNDSNSYNKFHQDQIEVNDITDAIENFSNIATNGLNHILTEIKSNRNKTELISDLITKQNEDLEKINMSSQLLHNRVMKINTVLKSDGG